MSSFMVEKHPKVMQHLAGQGIALESITVAWLPQLFVNVLPIEHVLRLWDSWDPFAVDRRRKWGGRAGGRGGWGLWAYIISPIRV